MGLLEQLAAAAIKKTVIATLRGSCPTHLQTQMEQLLGDAEAISQIQNFIMASMKNPAGITPEAICSLNYSQETTQLLAHTPELVQFLVQTAQSKLNRN